MRKYLKLVLIGCFLFIIPSNAFAEKDTENNRPVEVQLNQNKIEFPDLQPLLIKSESRIIVPVRFIAQQLGAIVHWDNKKQEVYITLNDKVIILGINNNYAMINQNKVTFDSAAKLINGRTYVPLRFVLEALKCSVDWDNYRYIVHITTKGNERPVILPSRATGDKLLDAKAIAALDSNLRMNTVNIMGSQCYRVIYSASDGSDAKFTVDLSQRVLMAIIWNFDKSIFKSIKIKNAYKKVLEFYFDENSDEAWDYIIKMSQNKNPLDESKEFGNHCLTVRRMLKGDDLIIFVPWLGY